MTQHLDKAINKLGGYPAVARKMGVTRQTLYRWASGKVPAEKILVIERKLGVPRTKLRPDIFKR